MVTIKELRNAARTKRRDPIYTFMDFLAYYPAKIFIWGSLTANQITIFWIIGQIISCLFLITGNYLTTIIALLSFQSMFILDCADGIVARYKNQFTLNGIYLDYLGHYIANPLLLICFGIGVARSQGSLIYIVLGISGAFLFLLNKAITLNPCWYKNKKQREKIENSLTKSLLTNQNIFLSFLFSLFRLEYLFNFMFWGVLFGYANYTLIIYVILFFLELLRKIITQLFHNYKLD